MSKSFVSSSVTAGTVENTLQATPMLSETQHLRSQVPTNYNSSCYNDDDDEIVWPISSPSASQSSTASPVPTESIHLTVHTCTELNYSTTLTINNLPIIGSKEYIVIFSRWNKNFSWGEMEKKEVRGVVSRPLFMRTDAHGESGYEWGWSSRGWKVRLDV